MADWSYDLLDEAERLVFERLSVFADGTPLGAARAVCAGNGVHPDQVERLLARLVDKSLVYVDRAACEPRYRVLQTLHDYADARLAERGTLDEVRRAHATWVRELASSVEFGAPTTGPTIAAVQDEDIAIRDAITWSIGTDPHLALDICNRLGPFWFATMSVSTGWDLLSSALDAADDHNSELRASAVMWAIVFGTMVHEVAAADRLADEAWAFEQSRGDPERLGRVSFARALAAGYRGDNDSARWVAEARRQFTISGSDVGLGHLSFADGATRLLAGDRDGAAAALSDAAATFRRVHDDLGLILAISRLGELGLGRQDLDQFADLHAELLTLGNESRSPGVITGATARLAHARLEQGRVDDAERLAEEALASVGGSFIPVVNGYAFKAAGLVNLKLGHIEDGRAQLRAAIKAFERGTGALGSGLAASCRIDLSRSFLTSGSLADTLSAATVAVDHARASSDPWILEQAEAQLTAVRARRSSRGFAGAHPIAIGVSSAVVATAKRRPLQPCSYGSQRDGVAVDAERGHADRPRVRTRR